MSAQRVAYFAQRLSLASAPAEHDIYRKRLLDETDAVDKDEDALFAKGGPYDQVVKFALNCRPFISAIRCISTKKCGITSPRAQGRGGSGGNLTFDDPDVAAIQEKNYNELLDGRNKAIRMLRE